MSGWGQRLLEAVRRRGTPTLVGLDPRFDQLPAPLRQGVDVRDPADVAACFLAFCRGVIDVVAPLVPAVKPQAAFFEQLGPAGMQSLAEVIRYARERELLVILDGKRNDIGSTAAGYADAYLGRESVWSADALTVSPYLGDDSLTPFVEVARQRQAGIFVLVKTSNPGSGLFQDLQAGDRPVYRYVAEHVARLASETADDSPYGCVGAVVGATYPDQLRELRSVLSQAWILVPGFGAQGGSAADVAGAFDAAGEGALVNSSRGIIFAYRREPYAERFGDERWQDAVQAATHEMIGQLREATG